MKVTLADIGEAKILAEENYHTWGQYIVECYTGEELAEQLAEFDTLEEWVEIRQRVAEIYEERMSTQEM